MLVCWEQAAEGGCRCHPCCTEAIAIKDPQFFPHLPSALLSIKKTTLSNRLQRRTHKFLFAMSLWHPNSYLPQWTAKFCPIDLMRALGPWSQIHCWAQAWADLSSSSSQVFKALGEKRTGQFIISSLLDRETQSTAVSEERLNYSPTPGVCPLLVKPAHCNDVPWPKNKLF